MSKKIKILFTLLGIVILLVLLVVFDELRYLYGLLLCICCTVVVLYAKAFPALLTHTQPAQSVYAKVVNKKRSEATVYGHFYVTFEFQDGTEKEFKTGIDFKTLRKNDTGILTYKEAKNGAGKDYHHRYFIGFEKDPS